MGIKRKRFMALLGVSLILGIVLSLLGGFKLMIYLLLLITGLVIGWNANRLKRVISDYRLALKVNTVQFSSKQTEEMKEKIRQLEADLRSAEIRLNLKEG